jgi:hypothetical protein
MMDHRGIGGRDGYDLSFVLASGETQPHPGALARLTLNDHLASVRLHGAEDHR